MYHLHFCRPIRPLDDLPTQELVDHVIGESHMLTLQQTLDHWPRELYQTDPVIDRLTRDTSDADTGPDLLARAVEQVERRLARYQPVETDAAIDAEMQRIIRDGLEKQESLPDLPPPPQPPAAEAPRGRRGRPGRRRRKPAG